MKPVAMKPIKTLKSYEEINEAFNWLFFEGTPEGGKPCKASIQIDFFAERSAPISKDNPNLKIAVANWPTPYFVADINYKQPLPALDQKKMSFAIHFFIDEPTQIIAENIDFTGDLEGNPIAEIKNFDGESNYYVPIVNFFKLARNQYKAIEVQNSDQFTIVVKGKSTYKVFDLGGESYKILRADNGKNLNPSSPHGQSVVKEYKQIIANQ